MWTWTDPTEHNLCSSQWSRQGGGSSSCPWWGWSSHLKWRCWRWGESFECVSDWPVEIDHADGEVWSAPISQSRPSWHDDVMIILCQQISGPSVVSNSNICDLILRPLFVCLGCIVQDPIVQPRWIHCRSHALMLMLVQLKWGNIENRKKKNFYKQHYYQVEKVSFECLPVPKFIPSHPIPT